jgi:hypothetical protein
MSESQSDDIIYGAELTSNPVNAPVENIRAVNSGDEFFACLQAIPPGRNAKSQGYSYNRFIKVLNSSGNLPVEFTENKLFYANFFACYTYYVRRQTLVS